MDAIHNSLAESLSDDYMLILYHKDDRLSLEKHKTIHTDLSLEQIKMAQDNIFSDVDLFSIYELERFKEHDKFCKCKNSKIIKAGFQRVLKLNTYSRRFKFPVYGLLIKSMLSNESQINLKMIDDYILVDYFYDLEDLNNYYSKYEKLVVEGKILLKVFMRNHPIDKRIE